MNRFSIRKKLDSQIALVLLPKESEKLEVCCRDRHFEKQWTDFLQLAVRETLWHDLQENRQLPDEVRHEQIHSLDIPKQALPR